MDGRVTDPAPIWHLISGDWHSLAGDRLERCKAAIRNRLPSLSVHIDAESIVAHTLGLPFYDSVIDGVTRGMELCQLDLPFLERDGRWLRRWLLVLWDGADEALAVDGGSRVIHDLNERIGLDFGDDGTELQAARLQLYIRFFCAAIAGDDGTFPIIEHPADLGWHPANPDLPLVGEATHAPGVPGLDGTLARLTLAADPEAVGSARVYRSPSVYSTDSVVMCYGVDIFRVQIELKLDDRRENGRWHSGRVEMPEDSGPITLSGSVSPLLIQTWAAGFASMAASDGGHETVSLAGEDFASLLRHPRLRAAQQGRLIAAPADTSPSDGIGQALWSIVLRYWGVPAQQPIQVNGDVVLQADAWGRDDRQDLNTPVVIQGDVIFPAGIEFGHPIRLAHWSVEGRLRAKGARFGASVELADFMLHNRLPKAAGADGGPRDPFAQRPIQYHETAVDLDEIRVGGALDLRRLTASGELSIRAGRIEGDMLFDEVLLAPRALPLDRPILNAERLTVAGSARCRRLSAAGLVVLDNIRVDGTLDLSGTVIHSVGYGPSGLRIDRAKVDGDLLINERRWSRNLEETLATIVSGDISIASTEVGGNIELTATYVLGSLNLPSSRVGGRIAIGVSGLAAPEDGTPAVTHLLGSYIAESVDLDHVHVGQMIFFDGVVIEQYLAMTGLRADGIRVASGAVGAGLIVRGHDSFGRSIRLFGSSVGALEVEGIQLGGSCWMVGLTVGPRFRLMPARLPAGRYEAEPAMREQAARARRFGSGATWREVHDGFIADATAIAAEAPRLELPAVFPPGMSSLMMYESRCAGNLELWGLALDAAAGIPTGPPDRALHLRNTMIDGNLSLHDSGSAAGKDADAEPSGMIIGNVLVEGGRVGGTADFSAVRVVGNVELRNIELHGGLQVVDAILIPASETSGGCLAVVNVRSAADLLLSGTIARQGLVRNSRIEGDLEISSRTVLALPPARAQFESFEATGNIIDGRILLQNLDVTGSIDLSDTRAARGLTIGAESP